MRTKQEIYKLLRQLAAQGKSVLYYTSELEEVQRVCDRAIVIFGGWNPVRGAIGAYFFGFLETLASFAQSRVENIPTQVFSVLPFVLMILVLALTSGEWLTRLLGHAPPWLRRALSANLNAPAPAALGRPFEQD